MASSDGSGERDPVRYVVEAGIATVTLHRPHRGNAWCTPMENAYRAALARAEDDPEVRAIIVTGAGRQFCVGGDAKALAQSAEAGRYVRGEIAPATPGHGVDPLFDQDWSYHFGIGKPILAAINGAVAGIGLALACFCDLRFAAAGAKFTTAHGRLNLPAEFGLSWILPRMIGLTRANELLLSSRVFRSEEAEALGIVNAVLPGDELLSHVAGVARELARTVSPGSLRATKHQIYLDLHRDAPSSVADSKRRIDAMMGEPDFAEGVRALREKRDPEFGGS